MATRSGASLRSWIVRVTIASFSLAALMGVLALLRPGELGETEAKVLLTTVLVGTGSVLVLCYLATAGTRYSIVGVAGGIVVVVPLLTALTMIWGSWEGDVPEAIGKTFTIGAILAVTLAQGCLLLVVAAGRGRLVGRLLAATLVLAAALAGLTSALVVGFEPEEGPYFRLLGVVAILDVLGTVVVPALARFGGRVPPEASGRLVIPPDLEALIIARATATGQRPDELLRALVEERPAGNGPVGAGRG